MIKLRHSLVIVTTLWTLLLLACQVGCQSVQQRPAANKADLRSAGGANAGNQNLNLPSLRRQRREAVEKDVTRKLEQARSLYCGLNNS
jgi:hypothetical protein